MAVQVCKSLRLPIVFRPRTGASTGQRFAATNQIWHARTLPVSRKAHQFTVVSNLGKQGNVYVMKTSFRGECSISRLLIERRGADICQLQPMLS